jgi:hypothetical protein
MLAAPSILSQHYNAIPKPGAKCAAASKFVASESLAFVEEGATAVLHQVGRGRWRCHVSSVSVVSDERF